MIKKITSMLLTSLAYYSSCDATGTKHHWQFSPDFLAQHQPKEPIYSPTYQPEQFQCTPPQESALFSYENVQRIINSATVIFATIKIYGRYQAIGAPLANDHSWALAIKQYLASWCPAMLQSVGIYGNFLIDSTTIVFEALIYKAIAKLVLLCAQGDLSDLIGSIAHNGIHAAKQLL